ncbi:hypothetical protein P879_07766 [Paragonimus westermani]|uniref:SAP domain-containing protein n=1 Tax=Paragonimus westermani TaxID=34504 RepID=A0A8T0DVW4_9TREM|nr:hypothetical protein P879_07766 [Paragonimus westermani]
MDSTLLIQSDSIHTSSIDEEGDEEETRQMDKSISSTNSQLHETGDKRPRKKVQRLSETLNMAHVARAEQRAKIVKEMTASFEAGRGSELGAIPLIDATIRKTKPINLKPLHLIAFGRLGGAAEVRTNLRRFRGFAFDANSSEYTKKLAHVEQRSTNELREALRILNLEVSGSRQVMAARLMEFLLEPVALKVKYKGEIKKSGRSHKKESDSSKKVAKPKVRKSPSSKTNSSEVSGEEPGQDDSGSDIEGSISSEHKSSSDEEYGRVPKKRGRPLKAGTKVKQPRKRRAVAAESNSDDDGQENPIVTKQPSKTLAQSVKQAESDEDVPLASLAGSKKPTPPSDVELKECIISILKVVNLEETSLKVVREQVFSRFPGVDLTGKKDFINTTVKEYLSQS